MCNEYKDYDVEFCVTGYINVPVRAMSIDEAVSKARFLVGDSDFNCMYTMEFLPSQAEDEDGLTYLL